MDAPTATVIAAIITAVVGAVAAILVGLINARPKTRPEQPPAQSEELPLLLKIAVFFFGCSLFSFAFALLLYVAGAIGMGPPGPWVFSGLMWLVPAVPFLSGM
jgi:hypothetical protein